MANRTCSIDGCDNEVRARGWCNLHYQRWYEHGDAAYSVADVRACANCGSEIRRMAAHGPLPSYCSTECKRAANKEGIRRSNEKEKARRRQIAARARAAMRKTCPNCGSEFTPEHTARQMYCSKRCMKSACGESSSTSCSVEGCDRGACARGLCKKHWKALARVEGRLAQSEWNDRRRAAHHEREAAKRGVESERFSPRAVFERDDWVCGICGEPVDPDLQWPDPMSASLDHIIPLSRSGAHTRANTQCSHLRCNISKGNQMVA